jgi:hypothetical protein
MRLTNSFDNLHGFGAVPDIRTTPMHRETFSFSLPTTLEGERRERREKRERKKESVYY